MQIEGPYWVLFRLVAPHWARWVWANALLGKADIPKGTTRRASTKARTNHLGCIHLKQAQGIAAFSK